MADNPKLILRTADGYFHHLRQTLESIGTSRSLLGDANVAVISAEGSISPKRGKLHLV